MLLALDSKSKRKMKAKYLMPDEYHLWDEFVTSNSNGTVFHSSKWLNFQKEPLRIFTISEDGEIVGGFAYIISKKAGINGIYKPPYTPYYHPLIKEYSENGNSEKEIQILGRILDEIKKHNISLIFNSKIQYFIPYQQRGLKISPKLNYTLDPTLFQDRVSSRKKSMINKYARMLESGDLRIESSKQVNDLLQIWKLLGKQKSMNIYDSFLNGIFSEDAGFSNWGGLKIFNKNNELLAGAIYLYDVNRVYNLIPIVNYGVLQKKEKNIGDLLYDRLIAIALERKLEFDFEGSEVPGVEMMYRRLGGSIDLKHTATKYDFRLTIIYYLIDKFRTNRRKKLK